ncbi:MAG: ABC transporter permease, partial [Niastella sp.]|nr:ABC transporter permease [Niastella sp.]
MYPQRLKIALRTLWKQRFYTALNVLGLSLGIAIGIILFQFIRFHSSFDNYHPDAGQLYKVVTEVHLPDGAVINEGGTPLALTKALKDQIPQVKKETVLLSLKTATISVPLGNQVKHFAEHGNIAFADANWFNMFSYIGAAGNAVNLSPEPGAVVITQRLAEKYFGSTNAIGKVVRLDNTNNLTITGIIENYPGNTDLKFDMFIAGSSFRSFYPQQEADMNKAWGWINSTTQS